MITKFFGQFLLEKNIINREQLLETLDQQRKRSPLLGELAVELDWLTLAQSQKINQLQMQQDKRFGDIAVELGYLSDEKVGELLDRQRKQRPYIGEILVSLGHLEKDDLQRYLDEHQAGREAAENDYNAYIDACFNPEFVRSVANVFPKVYQRVCKRPIALSTVKPVVEVDDLVGPLWYQDVKLPGSSIVCRTVLSLPSDHALMIGSAFMSIPLDEFDALAIDSVNEFVNTLTGHVYHQIAPGLCADNIEPPCFEKLICEPMEEAACLSFDTGQFQCDLILQKG